jgi:hypothetical protein
MKRTKKGPRNHARQSTADGADEPNFYDPVAFPPLAAVSGSISYLPQIAQPNTNTNTNTSANILVSDHLRGQVSSNDAMRLAEMQPIPNAGSQNVTSSVITSQTMAAALQPSLIMLSSLLNSITNTDSPIREAEVNSIPLNFRIQQLLDTNNFLQVQSQTASNLNVPNFSIPFQNPAQVDTVLRGLMDNNSRQLPHLQTIDPNQLQIMQSIILFLLSTTSTTDPPQQHQT